MLTMSFSLCLQRCFGTNQSLQKFRDGRLKLSYESREAAKERTEKRIVDETSGKRKPKQHAVDFSKVIGDKETLLKEVQSYPHCKIVN